MAIDYSKVAAKEVWASSRPKQRVIIGDDENLAKEFSELCKGNVEVVKTAEGNEYLYSHLVCEFRDGKVLDPPEPFVYPEDDKELFKFFELDKVYHDPETNALDILIGESRFVKLVILKELERRGYSSVEVVTDKHTGIAIWENDSLESQLRIRLIEAGATKAYAMGDYPNWTVITSDAKSDLDLHDLFPDVTTASISWSGKSKELNSAQCIFSKGAIMCALG